MMGELYFFSLGVFPFFTIHTVSEKKNQNSLLLHFDALPERLLAKPVILSER